MLRASRNINDQISVSLELFSVTTFKLGADIFLSHMMNAAQTFTGNLPQRLEAKVPEKVRNNIGGRNMSNFK